MYTFKINFFTADLDSRRRCPVDGDVPDRHHAHAILTAAAPWCRGRAGSLPPESA